MPLLYQNAYGGLDNRFHSGPFERRLHAHRRTRLQFDHPGLYPRNPVGKGYLVIPDSFDEVELPNLEDPPDLLTAERLITAQARALVSAAFALVLRLDRRADLPTVLVHGPRCLVSTAG